MPYEPKFKTGQLIERSDNSIAFWLVVGTYAQIADYSSSYFPRECYDDSNEEHTMYMIYNDEKNTFDWLFEKYLTIYCSNVFKGKTILLKRKDRITSRLEIRYELIEKFAEKFLTPPEKDE